MKFKSFISICVLFISLSAYSQDLKSPEANKIAQELKKTINQSISKIIEYERAAGNLSDTFKFSLKQGLEENISLGLIVNKKTKEVILISPGSYADNVGVKSGDILEAFFINKKEVTKLTELSIQQGDKTTFHINRNGVKVELNDYFYPNEPIPAWELTLVQNKPITEENNHHQKTATLNNYQCATLSTFFTPPAAKSLYPVFLTKVNNTKVNSDDRIIRVRPGKYKLVVHHLIPFNELIHAKRYKSNSNRFLELDLEVEADKSYYLASLFDNKSRYKKANEKFWEPVVWKSKDKPCKWE